MPMKERIQRVDVCIVFLRDHLQKKTTENNSKKHSSVFFFLTSVSHINKHTGIIKSVSAEATQAAQADALRQPRAGTGHRSKAQKGGGACIIMADSSYMAETTTTL